MNLRSLQSMLVGGSRPMSEGKRSFAPDFVRATATILIVVLHASMPPVPVYDFSWWINTGIHGLTRIGVPLFFLLSGWMLLNARRTESVSAFFRARFSRVCIPFIAWSALWLLWRAFHHHENHTWPQWLKLAVNGGAYYHLWFFPVIIKLYLLTPLVRPLARTISITRRAIFVILWAFGFLAPTAWCSLQGTMSFSGTFTILAYGGYFVLGSILPELGWSASRRTYCWIGVSLSWLITLLCTRLLTQEAAHRSEVFMVFHMPNVAFMSICAFLLLINYSRAHEPSPKSPIARVVSFLGVYSIGIYAIHPLPLELCWNGFFGAFLQGATGAPAILVVGASAMLSLVLSAAMIAMIGQVSCLIGNLTQSPRAIQ